jgi:hypothetical protein
MIRCDERALKLAGLALDSDFTPWREPSAKPSSPRAWRRAGTTTAAVVRSEAHFVRARKPIPAIAPLVRRVREVATFCRTERGQSASGRRTTKRAT